MKKIQKLSLSILPEKLGVCHFAAKSAIPDWAKDINFCSITRTSKELSIICPQDKIPAGVLVEKNWRALKINDPIDLYSIGVISSLVKPLADAGISILEISTYETEHTLVEDKNLAKAKKVLGKFFEIKK